ncbi:Riboflavin transporter MCH5-like protein 1 [Elsinoe fawcettii]|nr:Riboflavin transporter MCH5-like protein 1 [Elsinoe fawcettii]
MLRHRLRTPEARAVRVVVGCWLTLFPASGLLNSIGAFQAHLIEHDLSNYTESEISWIFSVFAYLFFFGGLFVGPAFDRYGSGMLLAFGAFGLSVSLLMTSFCTEYYQYFLAFGLLGGISSSFLWTVCVAVIGHWYSTHQALATGLATTAGGIGGIVFPILISSLAPKLGFPWTLRILTAMTVVFLLVGLSLVRTKLPKNKQARLMADWKGFRDQRFTVTMIAIFILDWAVLVPGAYITTYAISAGISRSVANKLLPVMNAAAIFGRFLPGMAADVLGRYNVTIICAAACSLFILSVWMTARDSVASIVVFSIFYGFFSGPAYSLTPVCVAQLCRREDYATKYGTAYGVVSFATLFGIPLSGLVLGTGSGNNYQALVIFCGVAYVTSAILFVVARVICCGWSAKTVF